MRNLGLRLHPARAGMNPGVSPIDDREYDD